MKGRLSIRWDIVSLSTQLVVIPGVVIYLSSLAIEKWNLPGWVWIVPIVVTILALWVMIQAIQRLL